MEKLLPEVTAVDRDLHIRELLKLFAKLLAQDRMASGQTFELGDEGLQLAARIPARRGTGAIRVHSIDLVKARVEHGKVNAAARPPNPVEKAAQLRTEIAETLLEIPVLIDRR